MGSLVERRRVLGEKLPYDAEVEYIENTISVNDSHACITLDYIPQGSDIEIYVKFLPIKRYGTNVLNYIYTNYVTNVNSISTFRLGISGNSDLISSRNDTFAVGKNEDIPMTFNDHIYEVLSTKATLYIDGVEYTTGGNGSGGFTNENLHILSNYILTTFAICRLYNFKLSKANNLIFNLIPVRVGNIGYLYNKVDNKLYGTANDVPFIVGPDINS